MDWNLEFITTPTINWLHEHLKLCRRRFWVASPFVRAPFSDFTQSLPADVDKVLLTRTDLHYFASGYSDLEMLGFLCSQGVKVKNLAGLHAKLYVVDDIGALVTSANATRGG